MWFGSLTVTANVSDDGISRPDIVFVAIIPDLPPAITFRQCCTAVDILGGSCNVMATWNIHPEQDEDDECNPVAMVECF